MTYKKLNADLKKITERAVGNDFIRGSVLIGFGTVVYVKTRAAAEMLERIHRDTLSYSIETGQEFELDVLEIEPEYEEIDILDNSGELIDIKQGCLIGYKVTTRKKSFLDKKA